MPDGMGGYNPSLTPMAFDPQGAKKLLTEAGYPNGFGLTVHGSNNRFPNNSQVAQAIGQMFSHGGLRVNGVEVLPVQRLCTGRDGGAEITAYSTSSYGTVESSSLNGLCRSRGNVRQGGRNRWLNRARYSNPQVDALLKQAATESMRRSATSCWLMQRGWRWTMRAFCRFIGRSSIGRRGKASSLILIAERPHPTVCVAGQIAGSRIRRTCSPLASQGGAGWHSVGRARVRRSGGTLQSLIRCSSDALSLSRSLPVWAGAEAGGVLRRLSGSADMGASPRLATNTAKAA